MKSIDLTRTKVSDLITGFQCLLEEVGDVEIIFEDTRHRQFEIQYCCKTGYGQCKVILREVLWDRLK